MDIRYDPFLCGERLFADGALFRFACGSTHILPKKVNCSKKEWRMVTSLRNRMGAFGSSTSG